MNENKFPPLPNPKFTATIRGVPCITVTEHEHLMRAYAQQARAQVQGEPVAGEWFCGNCRVPVPSPASHPAPSVPMTDDERGEAYLKQSRTSEGYRSTFMRGVWAAEIHHGIKSKEQA